MSGLCQREQPHIIHQFAEMQSLIVDHREMLLIEREHTIAHGF